LSGQELVEPAAKPLLPKQPEVNIGSAGHVDHGKCIRWDEWALVNGMPLTGKDIESMVLGRGALLSRLDGGELYKFDENEVVSIDGALVPRKSKSLFYVQEYSGPMYLVTTRTGRKITVTPEHPLLVNRNGSLEWVRAKELAVGDHAAFLSLLPATEGTDFGEPVEKMRASYQVVTWQEAERLMTATGGFKNLSALGPREFDDLRILAGIPGTVYARRARIDYGTWKALLSGKKRLTGPIRSKLSRAFVSTSFARMKPGEFLVVKKSGRRKRICRLTEFVLDDDAAKWFAFVWSEGTSTRHRVEVTRIPERRMLSEYLRITRVKLGLQVRANAGGTYSIDNTAFVDYLRLKFGFTPGNRFGSPISAWVCRLPGSQRANFLRWFFSLDGEFNSRTGQISVTQANPNNVVMLSYMLATFGIVPRFGSRRVLLKRGPGTYTRLSISGRRNLELFARNVGFESRRKQKALVSYLARVNRRSKESDLTVPVDASSLRLIMKRIGLAREHFRQDATVPTMKGASWYGAYGSLGRTGSVSKTKFLEIIQALQDQLDRLSASLALLPKNPKRSKTHLNLMGMSLLQASRELHMGPKKLGRILARGRPGEVIEVVDALCKWTSDILREAEPTMAQLRAMASTPLEFDRISSIKKEDYQGRVFDLSVPEHSNFVAGMGAFISHNTTTVQAITGVWASAHSEELRRGITIKVGYADAAFYRCPNTPPPEGFSTSPKCPVCGRETKLLRAVSFVDCPGHESLMTNMLAGAFLMDGALLVIAANESVPKPQTREHLQALQMLGMKKIVIAQNKVDLVTAPEAKKNFDQISKFTEKTVAEDAPVIPISAQQRLNIDALIEALEEVIPTPKRDVNADSLMYVVRSFDVNRPGAEISNLSGGVLGGSLTRGQLRVGDEVELRPGMVEERSGKYVPVITRISALQTGAGSTERVGPGGLVAVGTHLDPTFTKGDQMVGSVIGKPGTLPESLEHLTLGVELLETAVGSAELVKVDRMKVGENVRLNLGTASTIAVVTSARGDVAEVDLKKPVAVEMGMRAAISRRIAERWRLIGSGVLK
jgi:translation initiation factor 2 subunit 3